MKYSRLGKTCACPEVEIMTRQWEEHSPSFEGFVARFT